MVPGAFKDTYNVLYDLIASAWICLDDGECKVLEIN